MLRVGLYLKPAKLHDLPKILFETINNIKSLHNTELDACVHKAIQRNAFMLLSNNFVYSLLKSEDPVDRKHGWQAISSIRVKPSVTLNTIPKIDFNAKAWRYLVNHSDLSVEPAGTQNICDEKIHEYCRIGELFPLCDYPSHSQSVERAVKLVSWASKHVYGVNSRHQVISCSLLCTEVRPSFDSKSRYTNNVLFSLDM